MLKITDLRVAIDGQEILTGLTLDIKPGEVHAIMGPNGSGKSTLTRMLAGDPNYEVTGGRVHYLGEDLLVKSPEQRARDGVFLSYQYPVSVPGVSNVQFLKAAVNASRQAQGLPPLDAMQLMQSAREALKLVDLDESFLSRGVNEGFSGGEKKRNELLQMVLLKPRMCIMDETDSGLDIDALRVVAETINGQRDAKRSFLMITHYRRLLDYVKPDYVHVLAGGRIVASGGPELADELERNGYAGLAA